MSRKNRHSPEWMPLSLFIGPISLSVHVERQGGFLIPPDFRTELMSGIMFERFPFVQHFDGRSSRVPVTTPTVT